MQMTVTVKRKAPQVMITVHHRQTAVITKVVAMTVTGAAAIQAVTQVTVTALATVIHLTHRPHHQKVTLKSQSPRNAEKNIDVGTAIINKSVCSENFFDIKNKGFIISAGQTETNRVILTEISGMKQEVMWASEVLHMLIQIGKKGEVHPRK